MKALRQLLGFMRPFRGPLILAVTLTGALTLIGMAPPLLMRPLLNDVARQGKWGLFPLLMGLLFAVPVLRAAVNIANSLVLNRVGLGIVAKTRRRMFRRLMALSMRFYNEMPAAAVNQRLMGDVGAISGAATGGLITLVTDVLSLAFAVIVMVDLSWKLSLLTLALLPLYYLNFHLFSRRMRNANAELRAHMDHISSALQERLSAHELIQSYGLDREESANFTSQAKQVMDAAIRGSTYNISFNQLSAFINKLANTAIYCAGCYFFVRDAMGYGDVVAFCAYATQILGPVTRFAAVANQITQAGVSVDRVNEVLGREPAIRDEPDAAPIETLRGDLTTRGLAFQYEGGVRAIEDVNLTIPAGARVALVGGPGSGRTTLAMLMRRFYDPAEGRVEVDGRDIRGYRLRDYRRALALVAPETALFDGTIRENLLYGAPTATDEEMIEVARALGLHDFVASLAKGYDTRIGSGGLRLASGDRQRIGVARALLSRPWMLILDEATGTLDPDSAEQVHRAVTDFTKGKTLLIALSRLHMARELDEVIVLDRGRVVETGRHDALVRERDGVYRRLYAEQYGPSRLPRAEGG